MSLAKQYCKELIRQFDKSPVYLPGEFVSLGDIITFEIGKFGSRPIGSFRRKSTLANINIEFEEMLESNPDDYLFTSRGSVGTTFTADGDIGNGAKGKLEISFSKEGSTYFAALGTRIKYIPNLVKLEQDLQPHKDYLDWSTHYIVTAIFVAQKALIMQSNSTSASLSVSGEVKYLDQGAGKIPDAKIGVDVKAYKDAAFIKPWSENVEVFFDLFRFENAFVKDWNPVKGTYNTEKSTNVEYRLMHVDAQEGLIDEEQ